MNKRRWFLVVFLMVLVWILDRATKTWAIQNLSNLEFYGPFGLVFHRNPGAILGAFSDLPPLLRVVSLSTGGAFLIFIYGAIQYLLPVSSFTLRAGMSILLGGILGNVTDRILWGSVVDFLVLRWGDLISPAFNVADAVQWVGYFMIVFALFHEGERLWPTINSRKNKWVNKKFQLKYIFVLMFIGFGFALISGVFSFTYLKIVIDDLALGPRQMIEKKFLIPFLYTYGVIAIGFMITLFILGRTLSHRTAGPLYAFELFLEDLLKGKDRPLRLRSGDEFPHLEELAARLRHRFSQKPQLVEPSPEKMRLKTEEAENDFTKDKDLASVSEITSESSHPKFNEEESSTNDEDSEDNSDPLKTSEN